MLKLGKTTSCGSKECRKKGHRKGNKYDFYKDFIIGYDSNNNEFYIDKDDYEKVSSQEILQIISFFWNDPLWIF